MPTGTVSGAFARSASDTSTATTSDPPTEATTSEPTSSTPPQPVTDSSLETASKSFPHLKASIPTGLKSNTSLEPTSDGPKRKQLTRDQRLQIHTLRKAGHSYDFIVNFFKPDKVTLRQVAYAATQPIEPQNHRCGAKPKLDAETRRHIKDLMDKSAGPRPITYKEVSAQLGLGVSQSTLRRARYEDDSSTTKPYQYDKKKAIRAPSRKKSSKQPEAEHNAKINAPTAERTQNDHTPPATMPPDLAASWTASLQSFVCDNGPQPA